MQKWTYDNHKLDLVNMNAYIKFGEKMSVLKILSRKKKNWHISRAISLVQICEKMTCNNPKLDLAKKKAYIKFGVILPIGSQNIEQKRNFGLNKGP